MRKKEKKTMDGERLGGQHICRTSPGWKAGKGKGIATKKKIRNVDEGYGG